MPASVTSPADMINLSLRRIGYKLRVGSLYDGSNAAKTALDIYAQTRDAALVENDWDFAERNITMTLLKSAPVNGYVPPNVWNPATNPPPGYLFEYAYPSDSLKVRAVKPVPLFVVNFDPQPNRFFLANDNYFTPTQKVILCDVPNANLVYTGQVTDPTVWEPGFIEALAAALGRRLVPSLMGLNAIQPAAADEQQSLAIASVEQG
jgi:hypothetical protein